MRVLITGGMGFIGGRLSQYLSEAGLSVIIGSRSLIQSLPWLPSGVVKQINWSNDDEIQRACQGVDVVVHAAGMNVRQCAVEPIRALEFNGLATARLVDAAVKAEVKQFIYLSTAHVYSSTLSGLINEETCPLNLHPYATSHLAGEKAVLYASERHGLNGLVIRLSNSFGVPAHPDVDCWTTIVNELCKQAVTQQMLVLHGNCMQQRDFISISEVVKVINQFIKYGENSQFDFESHLVNLGSGRSMTLLELTRLIQARCKILLNFMPEIECKINKPSPLLKYQSNHFNSTNNLINDDPIPEIDQLLLYCNEQFKVQ